jgi:glc operon protein GlcG
MKYLVGLVCALMIAAPATTQTPAPPPASYGQAIAVKDALTIIQRGMGLSAAAGHKMAFAVVDPSGELVAFARMEDVPYASIRLAQQKARTAARLRISTAEMERRVVGGRTVLLSSDEVIAIGGGVPIVSHGRVIGAIGVSGGTATEDTAVAEAAITEGQAPR